MKKMYNKTVRGYYVMSVVLGLLLALSVALALEVALLDAMMSSSSEVADTLDKAWMYLPLGLENVFYGTQRQAILMVTTAIMTVVVFVRMSATKGSRTKMLQAVAVAILVLLLMLAYRYALRSRISDALALVPVLLMVIPLIILRKTQQPFETGI